MTDNSQSFNDDQEIFKSQKKPMIEDDTSTVMELRPFNNRIRNRMAEIDRKESPVAELVEKGEKVPFYPEVLESTKLYSD
jgi:hypothetical protein